MAIRKRLNKISNFSFFGLSLGLLLTAIALALGITALYKLLLKVSANLLQRVGISSEIGQLVAIVLISIGILALFGTGIRAAILSILRK